MDDSPENFLFEQTANDVQHIRTEITEVHTEVQQLPADKLCTPCLELNLIEVGVADTFKTCPTCQDLFCNHAASRIDPQYCIYCCNDFQVTDAQEVLTRQIKNEDGRVTGEKRFRIRHLGLGGAHWLFYNRAIVDMSDRELDAAIEYHRGIRDGMLAEREARRAAHLHRNKGKIAGNESLKLGEMPDVANISSTTTTSRKVRTVKTSTHTSTPATEKKDPYEIAAAAIKILMEKGYKPDQISGFSKK